MKPASLRADGNADHAYLDGDVGAVPRSRSEIVIAMFYWPAIRW